jgi:UDP-N-acetylmuramate--alanine ligase
MQVHFIGIGGAGMSGIARVLQDMGGYQITGSDLAPSEALVRLEDLGARIRFGHGPENIGDADVVVYSSAIKPTNPELVEARNRGIRTITRGEMLAALFNDRKGVAVAGTHGKTTTTSMISVICQEGGLDPTVLIGGELGDIGGNAKLGSGDILVAESDESDGSFLKLNPFLAVVTNVEPDHLEYWGNLDRIIEGFSAFIGQVRPGGKAIVCQDDPGVRAAIRNSTIPLITYGLNPGADCTANDIKNLGPGSRFSVIQKGSRLGELELRVPGIHNVSNALAAVAAGLELGVHFEAIAGALARFHGAQRRFQTLGKERGIWVVDDYGHHPTEARATLRAARASSSGRVICLFQPHRFTRTKFLAEEFGGAFQDADEVLLAEVYSAGEEPIPGVSAQLIADAIRRAEGREIRVIPDREAMVRETLNLARPGDLILTMGAGDIYKTGLALVQRLGGTAEGGRAEA